MSEHARYIAKAGDALAEHIRSWWYGIEKQRARPVVEAEPVAAEEAAVEEKPFDRAEILQGLWGPGYLLPGGPEHVLSMVKPVGVNAAMSLLDLSAGLGGPSRFISKTFDVYITGYERDPELAARGNAMSVAAGFGRKVPITAYDPETVELRAGIYDAVYCQHLTCAITDKPRLFRMIMRSLKPRGQITFTDFVAQRPGSVNDPQVEALRRSERYPPQPWTVQQYTAQLAEIGFDVRITEDQSATFKTDVVEGWLRALKTFDLRALSRDQALGVLSEAELWVQRIAALDSGSLALYRFYAISKQGSL